MAIFYVNLGCPVAPLILPSLVIIMMSILTVSRNSSYSYGTFGSTCLLTLTVVTVSQGKFLWSRCPMS